MISLHTSGRDKPNRSRDAYSCTHLFDQASVCSCSSSFPRSLTLSFTLRKRERAEDMTLTGIQGKAGDKGVLETSVNGETKGPATSRE